MTLTTITGSPLLTPAEVGDLIINPLGEVSIAALVSTYVPTNQSAYRLPVATENPATAWVAEGEEIPISEADMTELATTFRKLAGLTLVSNELIADSNPQAAEVIGEGLVRDLAIKTDGAFFGTNTANPKAPAGLQDQPVTDITAGAAWTTLDPFNAAIYGAANYGRAVTAFVANPTDALTLANLKEGTGSNKTLLQPDPTLAGRRQVAGVALHTSPAVTMGEVWAIPQTAAYVVVREDAEAEADASPFFTSDRTAVRAKLRIDYLFPQPAAIHRITLDG
ncbi:MAG: phage major capsid protein [Ornithinimicrobium sp.]